MRISVINYRIIVSTLATVFDIILLTLFLTSFFLIGCSGDDQEMDNQIVDKGTCAVGMTLHPTESCTYVYNGEKIVFVVLEDGSACQIDEKGEHLLEFGDIKTITENTFLCVNYDGNSNDSFGFSASKNANGSWTVNRDGSQTFVIETGDDDTTLVLLLKYKFQINESSSKSFDVQWRTNTPQGPWSSDCFDGTIQGSILDPAVVISFTITGLKPGTTYQVRYRDRNTFTCLLRPSSPDSWSTIVEGTTSGKTP